jgi:glycosyltransferase involved in cell wall biosynthesis
MAHNPLKIMYLDTCTEMAGGQYSLLTLLKRLDRSRYLPAVFAPRGSKLGEAASRLGVEIHTLPFRSMHKSSHAKPGLISWPEDFFRSFLGVFVLTWHMRRGRVDVVHANTFKSALVGSIACFLARRPMVFHDMVTIRHGWLEKMVARSARKIIVVSSALAAKHGRALKSKVTLIYNGVDTDYMSPGKVSAGAGEGRPKTVCYLGRLSWEKGLDRLVEAAGLVVEKMPGVRFVLGGSAYTPRDVSYYGDLRQQVERLGLARNLGFAGHIDDARAFLMNSDVFVLPSRRESLGLVLLEAMSLEKPVVAFDVDGPREIITDGKDGLLVKPDDVEGLAEAIVKMLKNPEAAREAGRMGRETVISRFSAKTFADRVSKLYEEIAGPAPTAGGETA